MPHFLTQWITQVLQIPFRLQSVVGWYLTALMVETGKHSMTAASEISGVDRSQFSRLLSRHQEISKQSLDVLAKRIALCLARFRKPLVENTKWTVAVIVDATLHKRSSRHLDNAQKFNHGKGFVVGHQWTNIALVINGSVIPLEPIAFRSKKTCKQLGIAYKTEHEHVVDYLKSLDLSEFIGQHKAEEVVVLLDSGYDDKKIQNVIVEKGWDLIGALKQNRNAKTTNEWTNREKKWRSIGNLFHAVKKQAPWKTLYLEKKSEKKRSRFRTRRIEGYLNGLNQEVALVCSENQSQGRKNLFCTNKKVDTQSILEGYSIRWNIETFHRAIKNNFGLQDAGVEEFDSLVSHVNWVYCAYLLSSQQNIGEAKSIEGRQRELRRWIEKKPLRKIKQACSRFGDSMTLRKQCYAVFKEIGL